MQPTVIKGRAIIAVFCLCLSIYFNSALAQSDAGPDVRLVIDVSGSMKGNDPNNLRQPAVELLVELLPEESQAGVWTFGKWVNMLIPHKPVDSTWRETARAKSKQINSVGLYTNIGEALEKAAYDISYADSNKTKDIILLTDGMVDIDKDPAQNKGEWRRIVDEITPKLKQAGYRVHTIALSKNADRDLMDRLSVSTDGVADTAESAEDLMKIFLKAFDAAVPSEQVPLTDNAFVIDSSVEEFTALIFRKQGNDETEIVTPDQQTWNQATTHPELRWHRTPKYDLITVKRPLEGEWGVVGEIDPDSRITVVSNINLRLQPLPNNVLKGASLNLSALLQEDGKTISNPQFLSLMSVKAELMGGNNFDALVSLWDQNIEPANNAEGRYETSLPPLDKEGVYQVKVLVDGKTFNREIKHQITLRQAFSADVREQYMDGQIKYLLTVNAYQQGINYSKTQVIAAVTTPNGQKVVRPLSISELDIWQTQVTPDSEGTYSARIQVKGVSVDGDVFEYELDPMTFNYSADAGMIEAAPEFSEPEPKSTPEPEAPKSTPVEEPTAAEPEGTTTDEEPAEAPQGLPSWILYAILGVGNLLLIGIGYFVFKKLMSGPKTDILDELEQEPEAQATEAVAEAPPETEPEPASVEEEDDEEEPPMEDLDPQVSEPEPEPAAEMPEETDFIEPDDFSSDVSDDIAGPSESADQAQEEPEFLDNNDDIDDLDEMAMEIAEEAQAESEAGEDGEDGEDEDMVTAMLKAQGLDLAEEELDDAISSLIDDLDDEEDSEDDRDKP